MASPWWTRRAISAHLAVALLTPTFLGLGWWQLRRALEGNDLSWAYTFEWPIFAGYGIWLWWRIIKDQDGQPTAASSRASNDARDQAGEKTLASYNAYLASLHAQDAQSTAAKEEH